MPRMLLIDDEPRIVSFVSGALSAAGYGVDTALDGELGLQLARNHPYALVVLDLLLPGLDGVSVLRSILEARPAQPVLVLSALSDVDSKVRCLELGATDYLCKPFALSEFLARVRARLRQYADAQGRQRGEILTVGRLRLDVKDRVAAAGAGSVMLSDREFRVLEYLARRGGEVCTREELLAEVWGYSFDPGSNVVDVYVGRLRAKLGSQVIRTVRNVGYRIDVA